MLAQIKRFYANRWFLAVHAVAVAIALLAPAETFENHPKLAAIVGWLSGLLPTINNYASKSAFPAVTTLYFSFLLPLSPMFFFAVLRAGGIDERRRMRERYKASPRVWAISFFLFASVMIPVAVFFLVANPGYDFHLAPINSSRWALAILGPFFAGGISFGVLAFFFRGLGVVMHKEW